MELALNKLLKSQQPLHRIMSFNVKWFIVGSQLCVIYLPPVSHQAVGYVTCTQVCSFKSFNSKTGILETPVLRLWLHCTFFISPHGGSVMLWNKSSTLQTDAAHLGALSLSLALSLFLSPSLSPPLCVCTRVRAQLLPGWCLRFLFGDSFILRWLTLRHHSGQS